MEVKTVLRNIGSRLGVYRLIGSRRLVSSAVTSVYEPMPFDFEAIDQLVRKRILPKGDSIDIDPQDKPLFYKLLREANATVYASTSLGRNKHNAVKGEGIHPNEKKPEIEWLCDRISDRLQYYKLDNRIVILQRSLAAYHNCRHHQWARLAKTALRSCFINDEKLSARHIVKICAALSKWRFRNLSEIQAKLDLSILAESEWNLVNASHVLWSLSHLKCFDMKAFDYMNNVVSAGLRRPAFDLEEMSDDTIHRIINANLVRLSHKGFQHRVMKDILVALEAQPTQLSYLSPNTLMNVASLLPLYPETTVTSHLVKRISRSIHKFTHTQFAHMLSNFAIVKPYLSEDVVDDILSMLFEYKEMVYKSDVVYVPSLVCKLMITFRTFLKSFDNVFVSKCLSDLNSNLHLIVPYSLIGSLHCIDVYRTEISDTNDERQNVSVNNTWNNLIKLNNHGHFMKVSSGIAEEPIDNLKLWHMAALKRLTSHGYKQMMDMLINFMDRVKVDNTRATLKEFVMFLYNTSSDRALFRDRNFLNSVLIAVSHLWDEFKEHRDNECWHHIMLNLSVMGLREIFERECNAAFPHSTSPGQSALVAALNECLSMERGKCSGRKVLELLHNVAMDSSHENAEADYHIVRYILFMCLLNDSDVAFRLGKLSKVSIMDFLMQSFYEPSRTPIFHMEGNEEGIDPMLLSYMENVMQAKLSPIDIGMAYTRSLFLQDHTRLLLQALPATIMGELCPQKVYDVHIWDVARSLEAEGIESLTRYLESIRESKPALDVRLLKVAKNAKDHTVKINKVRRNFYIGPYMCHFGLMSDDGPSSVYVFLTDTPRNKGGVHSSEHVYDRQRILALENMGLQFIELALCPDDSNVV